MNSINRFTIVLITSVIPWIQFSSCHSDSPKVPLVQNSQQSEPKIPAFDEAQAFKYCERQVQFGPRVPNTQAHDECRTFLVAELRQSCDTVIEQSFEQNVYSKNWKLTNIIGRINPAATERILLCAHWDSRPRSDEDSVHSNFNKGVPAANDGASGVALLLELSKSFKVQRPEIGIDIVFFDGEDIGYRTDGDNFCIGSKYFAQHLPSGVRARYAILLDMVGDKDAQFMREQGSVESAMPVVDRIWQLGKIHASDFFVDRDGGSITDDHRSLIAVGIPAIDIIDIELIGNNSPNPRRRYWHTQYDDMSNISERTLGAVAKVLLHLVYSNPMVM